MLRLLFLSTTSLALVALPGCSDDACGPGDAPESGLLASSADVALNYGDLTSGPNNDCPDGTAPMGVTTLTIQGSLVGGQGLLTLCIPRPDLLQKGPVQLGSAVRIIDLNADAVEGCDYEFEALRPVTGEVSVKNMCDNGQTPKGYILTVDGALSMRRMCPTISDTIAVTFAGTVGVVGTP